MADLIKYTSQSLTGTVGTLQTGHHLSYCSFGTNADGIMKWSKPNAGAGITTYTATLPSTISGTTYTATVSAYAYFAYNNTYTVSNVATKTVEVRQHNTPTLAVAKTAAWVGENVAVTYTVTSNAYNKAVTVTASSTTYGSFPSSSSTATSSPATFSVTAAGAVTGGVTTFTAKATDPLQKTSSKTLTAYQPITELTTLSDTQKPFESLTVNSGGSINCYVAAGAGTYTDIIARTGISVTYTFTGGFAVNGLSTTGSTGATVDVPGVSGNVDYVGITRGGTGSLVKMTNVTTGGTVTFKTFAGEASNINTSSLTQVTKQFTINIANIVVGFYSDAACTKAMTAVNPGDYFYAKITGGSGTGTIAVTGGTSTVTTGANLNGGIAKISVNSAAANNSNVTVTVTPANGSVVSKSMSVKHITLTIS